MAVLIDKNGAMRVREARFVDLEKSMDQNWVNIVKWQMKLVDMLGMSPILINT